MDLVKLAYFLCQIKALPPKSLFSVVLSSKFLGTIIAGYFPETLAPPANKKREIFSIDG
jgi:hypothetical protein